LDIVFDAWIRRRMDLRPCLEEELKRKHPDFSEEELHLELTNCERQINRLLQQLFPKPRPTARKENRTNSSDQPTAPASEGASDE
jgi:hypothetical protein